MARIRSIKPEFWTSAQILECSTNARLLFVGLWNFSDDAGRHPDSAKQVKAEIFPADNFSLDTISEWLNELKINQLIIPYVFENKSYFYISGWKHQRIDKPQNPKYPDPFSEHSKIIPRVIPPDTIRYDTIREDTILSIHQPSADCDWPSDYREVFWNLYPRKVGKKAAIRKLESVKKTEKIPWASFTGAISSIKATEERFIPHPATWLNQGRWDDEPQGKVNGSHIQNTSLITAADELVRYAREAAQRDDIEQIGNGGGSGSKTVRVFQEK